MDPKPDKVSFESISSTIRGFLGDITDEAVNEASKIHIINEYIGGALSALQETEIEIGVAKDSAARPAEIEELNARVQRLKGSLNTLLNRRHYVLSELKELASEAEQLFKDIPVVLSGGRN